MMLKTYREHKGPFVDRKAPRALAERLIEELEIVTPGVTTPVRRLSGGNVQKVLVGREIASQPTVLMTAYPVRGLDINSSYAIYGLLNQQKLKGVAVILVGEEDVYKRQGLAHPLGHLLLGEAVLVQQHLVAVGLFNGCLLYTSIGRIHFGLFE